MGLLLLQHLLCFSPLELCERSTFVSGVVVQQNTRYLMERRKQELFAHFVERLPMRIRKWWWVALLNMRTKFYFARETFNHLMVVAGYMEMGESATEGAIRETFEEAGAEVQIISPFAHLDIPRIGQTYIIFLAKLKTPHFSPGPESSECRLFALDDIPFDSLSFSSMVVTLNLYIEDLKIGRPKFHYGIINKRPGTSPTAIQAYTLDKENL